MTKQVFHNNLLLKRGEIKPYDEIRIFKVNIIHLFAIKLIYLSIILLNGT